jgi:hypothetical protein
MPKRSRCHGSMALGARDSESISHAFLSQEASRSPGNRKIGEMLPVKAPAIAESQCHTSVGALLRR